MVTRPSETQPTGALSDAPEFAAAPPSRRRRRRGRGVLRALAVVVVVLGLAAAAAGAWLAIALFAFDDVADEARARLGTAADAQLAPAGSILDEPQLTLFYVTDSAGQGLGFTVLRTDPAARTTATLSFSSLLPVNVDDGPPIDLAQAPREGGPPAVLRALQPVLDEAPNHVVAISLQGLRQLVDTLGGVTVNSPAPFQSLIGDRAFPAGRIVIRGEDVEAFSSGTDFATASANQRRLMRAITAELADVGTLSDLPSIARSVGRPLTTDLGTRELLELGYVQARATSARECGATRPGSPGIASFMSGGASGPGCDAAAVPDVGPVPSERALTIAGLSIAALAAAAVALLIGPLLRVAAAGGRQVAHRRPRRSVVGRPRGSRRFRRRGAGLPAAPRPVAPGRMSRYMGRAGQTWWSATDALGSRARRARRPRPRIRPRPGEGAGDRLANTLGRVGDRRRERRAQRAAVRGRRDVRLGIGDRVADARDALSSSVRAMGSGTLGAFRRLRERIADSVLDTWDAIADRWDSRRRRR